MSPTGDPTRAQLEHAIAWIEGYLARDANRPWYLGREQRELVRHWLAGRPFISSAPRGSGRMRLAKAVQAYHHQLELKPRSARPR